MSDYEEIIEAINLLRPFEINLTKRRIGPNRDGGYVVCDCYPSTCSLISYGISTEYTFEEKIAAAGHNVYMFDHTIEQPVMAYKNMKFFKEGVAGVSLPGRNLDTIESHITKHGIRTRDAILKLDVEGAEYGSINGVSDSTISDFSMLLFEIHGLQRLNEKKFRVTFLSFMKKILKNFVIFHVHANNWDGPAPSVIDGVPVSRLLEISLVRRDLVICSPNNTVYPTHLDYPNTKKEEKLLWFYPFLPEKVSESDLVSCLRAANSRD